MGTNLPIRSLIKEWSFRSSLKRTAISLLSLGAITTAYWWLNTQEQEQLINK